MKEDAIDALEQVRDELEADATARRLPPLADLGGIDVVKRDLIGALRLLVDPRRSRSVRWRSSRRAASGLAARGSTRSSSCAEVLARRRSRASSRIPGRETPAAARGTRSAASRRQPAEPRTGSSSRRRSASPGSFDLHYRLVPRLRSIAAGLLASRRRVSLERESRRRRRPILGDTTWELVRPDRPRTGGPARTRDRAAASSTQVADALEAHRHGARAMSRRSPSDVLDEVEQAVVGKRDALELVLLGFLARRARPARGLPGPREDARRALVRAGHCSMRFARIQFTPDLMPSDVTGSSIWNQRDADFEFRPGPIFTNLLLADEINRAPPKTQAALLEAMQERQVDDRGRDAPRSSRRSSCIATQNPIEYEGTYPLPEAQLDRFLLRTAFGYPSREGEVDVLARRIERESDDVELRAVVDRETLAGDAARARAACTSPERPRVLRRPRDRDARRRRALRSARARAAASRCSSFARCRRRAPGARLRASRRRQGRRRAGARAPAGARARSCGCSACSAEDVVREVLDSVPTPRAEDVSPTAPLVTRSGNPRLIGYSALAAARVARRTRPPPARARDRRRAVRAPLVVVGTRAARDPRSSFELTVADERTLEGADLDAVVTVRARRPVDRLELLTRAPRTRRGRGRADAVRSLRLRAGEERELESTLRCTTWGVHELGTHEDACPRRPDRRLGGAGATTRQRQGVPEPDHAAPAHAARRDAGIRRQPGRAREGRGASSTRTSATSCQATGFARSTGAPPRGGRASSSTSAIRSGTRTSSSSSTASSTCAAAGGASSRTP